MTNKEAIELLTEVDELATENGEDGDGFVALKIAIEALKRENHDGCDGCREHFLKVDADGYLGLNGWLRHNGFEPYREGGES